MRHSLMVPIVGAALVGAGTAAAAGGWVDLFNGGNLDGWTQKGGRAKYEVVDGMIVGSSVMKTPNSFLCTEKHFEDFILEYEFKVDPRLNSGVQIRSNCHDKATEYEWQGKKKSVPAGRVHGYQVEIDPAVERARMWSAGIYEEGLRGWLCPGALAGNGKAFSKQGMKCFNREDWNHVRVEAIGPSIRTWINGTPRASLIDDVTPKGFIGLQVHAIKRKSVEGAQVAWRNLKIMEVKPGSGANEVSAEEIAEGWCPLWDGATTAGWRGAKLDGFPEVGWKIEDGMLMVLESGGAESAKGGDIVTRQRFARFELLIDFKITPGANSGIKYFCQPNLDPISGSGAKRKTGSAIGLEFQILDDSKHPDARKGRAGTRTMASLYDLMAADESKAPNPIGEWNTARVVTDGTHVEHWLNGRKALEYERGSREFKELVAKSKYHKIPGFGEWEDGHVLLQDHGNTVHYRNVKVRVPVVPKD